jgi:hypothetical protein
MGYYEQWLERNRGGTPTEQGGNLTTPQRKGQPPGFPLNTRPMAYEGDAEKGLFHLGIKPSPEPANWMTSVFARTVDDLPTRMKIFAEARGIPVDRYGEERGNIFYIGDDGERYLEEPIEWAEGFKRLMAEQVVNMPAYLGAAGGFAMGGIPGAVAGAGLGAAGRKMIGKYAFDEPTDPVDWAVDIGLEGGLAGLTGLGAKGAKLLFNELLAAKGGKLGRLLTNDRMKVAKLAKSGDVKSAQDLFKRVGIEPSAMELTRSNELAHLWGWLGKQPATADMVEAVRRGKLEDIRRVFDDFVDGLGDKKTLTGAGEKLVEGARKSIKRTKDVRGSITGPFYEKAKAEGGAVDTTPIVSYIDESIESLAPGQLKGMRRARDQFFDPDTGEQITDMERLINAKKVLDADIRSATPKPGVSPDPDKAPVLGELIGTKRKLNETLEETSENYAQGRKLHERLSPTVNRAEKGAVGRVAKLENERAEEAVFEMFAKGKVRPEKITARKAIMYRTPEGKKAWDNGIKAYLGDVFETEYQKILASDAARNLGGNFAKRYGSHPYRENIKAALGEKHAQAFDDLLDMMQRSARLFWMDSGTQSYLKTQAKVEGGNVFRRMFAKGVDPVGSLRHFIRTGGSDENAIKVAEALINPKAIERLSKINQLPKTGMKWAEAFSTWVGTYLGGEVALKDSSKVPSMSIKQMTKAGLSDDEIMMELKRRGYSEKQSRDLVGIQNEIN